MGYMGMHFVIPVVLADDTNYACTDASDSNDSTDDSNYDRPTARRRQHSRPPRPRETSPSTEGDSPLCRR